MTATLPTTRMETITITYQDRGVALAAPRRVWLAVHIQALPAGHPTKCVVAFMAFYARDVLRGELPGPYSDEHALLFAYVAMRSADP